MAPTTPPEHRAILIYQAGWETLILQDTLPPRTAADAAWLVPVPAYPEVTVASPGLFNFLDFYTRPQYLYAPEGWVLLALVLTALLIPLWLYDRLRLAPCLLILSGLSVIATCVYAPDLPTWLLLNLLPGSVLVTYAVRRQFESKFFLGLCLLLGCLLGIVLPNFIQYRGGGLSSGVHQEGVVVHERKQVSLYDIAILSAADPTALQQWLQQQGYPDDERTWGHLKTYVQRGWFVIAVRLGQPQAERAVPSWRVVQPLQVSFATSTLFYPLLLASPRDRETTITLHVFAPMRVQGEGFTVTFAAPITRPGLPYTPLAALLASQTYVTTLEARRLPDSLSTDLELTTAPEQERYQRVRLTQEVGLWMALTSGLLGACVVMVLTRYPHIPWRYRARRGVAISASLGLGCLLSILLVVALPYDRTAHRVQENRPRISGAVALMESIRAALGSYAADHEEEGFPPASAITTYQELARLVDDNGGNLRPYLHQPPSGIWFVSYTTRTTIPEGDSQPSIGHYQLTLALATDPPESQGQGLLLVADPEGITRHALP
jgi:hypothetical protein